MVRMWRQFADWQEKEKIPAYKIGKDWRFRRDALTGWAETHFLRSRPHSVLVIDDDAGVCKLIKRFLEAEGYRVFLSSDGSEGLECVKREPIDLVVLDLRMPGMNGPAFLKEIHKLDHEFSVIIATGYPDGDLMAEAIQYGPFTLIAKPINREHFIHSVRTALNETTKAR